MLQVVTKTEARGAIQNPRKSVFFIFCKESEKKNFEIVFQNFLKSVNFKYPKMTLNEPQTNADNILRILAAKQNWKKRVFLRFSWCQIFYFRWKVIISALKPWKDLEKNWYTGSFQYKKFQWKCVSSFIQFWYNSPPLRYDARDKNIFFSFLQINGSPTGKFWWLKQS